MGMVDQILVEYTLEEAWMRGCRTACTVTVAEGILRKSMWDEHMDPKQRPCRCSSFPRRSDRLVFLMVCWGTSWSRAVCLQDSRSQ